MRSGSRQPTRLRGRHVAVVSLAAVSILFVSGIHPFLAETDPVDADTLVVEAWLPKWCMPLAAHEFRRGGYRRLVAVGVPMAAGARQAQADAAAWPVDELVRLGIDRSLIAVVSVPRVARDQTWSYARAFAEWMNTPGRAVGAVNVFSGGVHARKSRLLFQRAVGTTVRVGVIAARDPAYSPAYWWLSGRGIYLVVKNSVSYGYALLRTGR
jgi:hypothetical protein